MSFLQEQHVNQFVAAEMLYAAESVADVLFETFRVPLIELLKDAAKHRMWRMGQSDERMAAANDICSKHHLSYMIHGTGTSC